MPSTLSRAPNCHIVRTPQSPPPRFSFFLLCSHRSVALWEGWVWRFLVARVFDNHDGELWEGYGVLKAKFLGEPVLYFSWPLSR